ncbi:MAG: AmmeMemoRadiSam system protein B, partial [Acidobacteriota bacterium]
MRDRKVLALFLLLLAPAVSRAQGIREAVFAGAFYDGDKDALAARIDGYLNAVKDLPAVGPDVQALICPQAGYIYS